MKPTGEYSIHVCAALLPTPTGSGNDLPNHATAIKGNKWNICDPSTVRSGKRHTDSTFELVCDKCSIEEVAMKQPYIVTVLAIIAVTGAVGVSNSLAAAWRLDVSDRHVVDRGGLEWGSLIHTVADTDVPPKDSWPQDENYSRYGTQLWGLRGHGASPGERSGYEMKDKSGSAGEERQIDTYPHGHYFRNDQSSAFPTSPYSGMIYGGVPTTPSADPMIKELSRELSAR